MCADPSCTDRINSFALVSYIPGRLGKFLDRLRRELVPACFAHAHVTVLPPRPLVADPESAMEDVQSVVPSFAPFSVQITGLEIFPTTSVIYAAIGAGREELIQLHQELNVGNLAFDEPFKYHPHITLAQGLEPGQVAELFDLASRRWKESAPAHSFTVEALTFVQNTAENRWIDLAEYELRGTPSLRT
jgi:2'-5' RNA ligase